MEWTRVRSAFIKAMDARTQDAVAKAAGVPQNYISRIVNNAENGPTVETFLKCVVAPPESPPRSLPPFGSRVEWRYRPVNGMTPGGTDR